MLFLTISDIFQTGLVFSIGFFIINRLRKKISIPQKKAFLIYIWHSLFCFIFAYFAINYGADATMYYDQRSYHNYFDGIRYFPIGTSFVVLLTYILSFATSLSFLATSFIFNIFGSIGLLFFYSSLKSVTKNKNKTIKLLSTFLIFLPSLSFWSAGIGKDSIAFLATGMALWSLLQLKGRLFYLVLSIFIMFLIRPHIAAVMLVSVTVFIIIASKQSFIKRFILSIVVISITVTALPFALQYAGVQDITEVVSEIETRQTYNTQGGSSIDIASMSLPMQMFSYLYRPLPYEARSISSLISSIDNTFILLLSLFFIGSFLKHRRKSLKIEGATFYWIFGLSTWIMFAMTTANLGIAVRQKWIFLPMLLMIIFSTIGKNRVK